MITSMTVVDKIIGNAPFVCEGDPVQGIAQAAKLGYDGVELHFTDPSGVDADAIEAALSACGLVLTAIGTGRAYVNEGLSISDPDEEIRQKAVSRLEDFLDLHFFFIGVFFVVIHQIINNYFEFFNQFLLFFAHFVYLHFVQLGFIFDVSFISLINNRSGH